jgi:hypothetical protein
MDKKQPERGLCVEKKQPGNGPSLWLKSNQRGETLREEVALELATPKALLGGKEALEATTRRPCFWRKKQLK